MPGGRFTHADTDLFYDAGHAWTPEVNAIIQRTLVESLLMRTCRFHGYSGRQPDLLRIPSKRIVILRFSLDRLALQKLDFIAEACNRPVLFLQGFCLQDWMPLRLGEVVLAYLCDLMQRASSTRLDSIALQSAKIRNGKRDVDHEAIQTLTLRCLQGLHES